MSNTRDQKHHIDTAREEALAKKLFATKIVVEASKIFEHSSDKSDTDEGVGEDTTQAQPSALWDEEDEGSSPFYCSTHEQPIKYYVRDRKRNRFGWKYPKCRIWLKNEEALAMTYAAATKEAEHHQEELQAAERHQGEHQAARREVDELREANEYLQNELHATKREANEYLYSEIDAAKEAALQEAHGHFQRQLEDVKENFQREANELRVANERLHREIDILKEAGERKTNERLQRELQAAKKAADRYQGELEDVLESAEHFQEELQAAHHQANELREANEYLQTAKEDTQRESNELRVANERHQRELKDVKEAAELIAKEHHQREVEAAERYQKKLEDVERKAAERYQRELKAVKEATERVAKEHHQKEVEAAERYQRELQAAKEANERHQGGLQAAQREADELREVNEYLQSELDAAKREATERHQGELQAAHHEANELREANEHLERELKDVKEAAERIAKEHHQKEVEAAERHQKKLEDVERKAAERYQRELKDVKETAQRKANEPHIASKWLQKALYDAERETNELYVANEHLQKALDDVKENSQREAYELREANEHLQRTLEVAKRYQRELQAAKEVKEHLQKELQALKEAAERIAKEHHQKEVEAAERHQRELQAAKEAEKHLQRQLEDVKETTERHQGELQAAHHEANELREANEHLERELDAAKREADERHQRELDAVKEAFQRELAALQKQLYDVQHEVNPLRETNEHQQKELIFTQSSGIAEPKKSKLGTTISSSINSGNKDESSLSAGQTIKIPRRLNRYCTERSKPPRPIRPANYYDVAAVLPEIKNKKDILAEVSRGECVYDATSINDADHLAWLDYGYACEAKIGCDIHTAFQHLAKNDYSIKRAMETIDAADSVPMVYIHGKHSTGIWTADEMQTFIRMMNNKNNYKKLHKISKQIPRKAVNNVVNTFYALKKLTCSPKCKRVTRSSGPKFNLCSEIIKKHTQDYTSSSCSSKDCHNCVYKLWLKPDSSPTDCKLCSLCSLYFKMFNEHRPNAEVTPLILDYSALEPHENCKLRSLK